MTTRIVNALLGVWLFASALMWPHARAEEAVTVVAGLLTVLLAILAIYVSGPSRLSAMVAVALFVAALALPTMNPATTWNNTIAAAVIFMASLLDGGPEGIHHERELYGRF